MNKKSTHNLTSEYEIRLAKSNRSQSEVITTVLIILLVLVAVFIVYVAIRSMIKGGTEQVTTSALDVSLTSSSTNLSLSLINVSVLRGAGEGNVTEIKIIFKNSAGAEVCRYENTTYLPGELETKVYYNIACPVGTVSSYEVYPVIQSGSREIIGLKAINTAPTTPASTHFTPPTNYVIYYYDGDRDGYYNGTNQSLSSLPVGNWNTSTLGLDCNDNDPNSWKNWTIYRDYDADGYGENNALNICGTNVIPPTYKTISGDCNDTNAAVHLGATEVYDNGIDEDCDGGDNITSCGSLNVANAVYFLNNDITAGIGEDCISINANNITIDLKGKEIKGTVNEYWGDWCGANYNGGYEGMCNSLSSSASECYGYYDCNGDWDYENEVSCYAYSGDENACKSHSSYCWWDRVCSGNVWSAMSGTGIFNFGFGLNVLNGKITDFSNGISLYNINQQNLIKNISVKGFVDSFGTKNSQCIYLENSNKKVTVEDSYINNCSIGIYLYSSSNNKFANNKMLSADTGMFIFYNSNNNTVFNNQISSSSSVGIYLYYLSQKNNITGNRITGSGYSGILNGYVTNNNTFYNNYVCNSISYDFFCDNLNNHIFNSNNCASSKIQGCGAGLVCSAC